MTYPLRATFGAKDNTHALLEWEGVGNLPPELLGLTDKPSGTIRERWWPSVGCGTVGEFWALWWTEPDLEARRGGMVRSRVALWPDEAMAEVDDLRPVMESLGNMRIPAPPADLLAPVAEALLNASDRPPVVSGLDCWPALLVELWKKLWPAARRRFSARVAVCPPQGGETLPPPWLLATPAECASRWIDHQLVVPRIQESLSREAKWFIGEHDERMAEVMGSCSALPPELGMLRRAARAAERLQQLRTEPSPDTALKLLRTLVAVAQAPGDAAAMKEEAIRALSQPFEQWSAQLALALANLDPKSLPGKPPKDALRAWTREHAHRIPLDEVPRFLGQLSDARVQAWWRDAALGGLSDAFAALGTDWAGAIIRWCGLTQAADVLSSLLPSSSAVEQQLVKAATEFRQSPGSLVFMRTLALTRDWSELHGWAVSETLPVIEALHSQLSFPGTPLPGLRLLVDKLNGTDLVDAAVKIQDPRLLKLLARRTVQYPELLSALDAGQAGWRLLWAAHLAAGGTRWPPGGDRARQSRMLLDLAIDGIEVSALIELLATDLATTALGHPSRAKIWPALKGGAPALLGSVAAQLSEQIVKGKNVPQPEPELLDALLSSTRSQSPSLLLLLALLRWDAQISEATLIQWLSPLYSLESPSAAHELGAFVLSRRWDRAAEWLYDHRFRSESFDEAAQVCRHLIRSWFWKWLGPAHGADRDAIPRPTLGPRSQIEPEDRIQTVVHISYADADAESCKALQQQLAPLEQRRLVVMTSRHLIQPGADRDSMTEVHLEAAEVILLLVSAGYLVSEEWKELKANRALEKRNVLVIPIIVSPCLWRDTELTRLQALPRDGRAVSDHKDHDRAWADIADALAETIRSHRP